MDLDDESPSGEWVPVPTSRVGTGTHFQKTLYPEIEQEPEWDPEREVERKQEPQLGPYRIDEFDTLGLGVEEDELWRGTADGRMPILRILGGPTVPDLARIAEARWKEVLEAVPVADRWHAAANQGLGKRMLEVMDLAESLPPAASDLARAQLDSAPHIPVPSAGPRRRSGRQLNVKVSDSEYQDIAVAARLLGARPTGIARMLVLNGVRRVLAEHDAAIAAARRSAT